MVAAISAVPRPTHMMRSGTQPWASAMIGLMRVSRYTPAVTMVAAWMRADTGVGPAMASGSQMCSGNWADLPAAPTSNSTTMADAVPAATPLDSMSKKISPYWSDPKVKKARNMATRKPQSPTRLVTNAFLPAEALASSVNQNEISR